MKNCESCEIVSFWQNRSFLGVVGYFTMKRCEVGLTAEPIVQIPFVLLTYAELLTQCSSFAVEIKRINNIAIFFSLTFHIWSILPFSLAFNATSASVAQVLINCFCGIPLYSMVNFMRYSKLISESNSYNLEKKFVLTCNTVACLIFLSYCYISYVCPSRGRFSTRNSNSTAYLCWTYMHDLTWSRELQ